MLCALFSFAQSDSFDSELKVTRYKLQPQELNIQREVNSGKVNLKIYYLEHSSIISEYHYFQPKHNEILFFYGKNKITNKNEMYFKMHASLKHAYKQKDFTKLMKLVKVLQYNVFAKSSNFSSSEAYSALQDSLKPRITISSKT